MRSPEPRPTKDGRITYRVRFREGISPDTGKPLQTSETFPTQREAEWFCQLLDQYGPNRALELIDAEVAISRGPTLDQLAEQYFTYKATRVRSDRTVADYRRDYRNWIQPTLGHRTAASITEGDVQALVDTMAVSLAPKSVIDRHVILHSIYKWAGAPSRRLVVGDPCLDTDLPKRRKTQAKGLKPNEWQALHSALVTVDPDAADLAEFLLATGWRFSEAAALSVFDVEDDGTNVHVSMGQVVRRNAAGQHIIVDGGKSDAALRRVALDDDMAAAVRRRIGSRTEGLVFTNTGGRQWHYANFLTRAWKPAVEAANLTRNPTPHWLRHTHVVWMILTGKATLPELQSRIGHENIATTIGVYGRMITDVSPDALVGFAAMRRGAVKVPEIEG